MVLLLHLELVTLVTVQSLVEEGEGAVFLLGQIALTFNWEAALWGAGPRDGSVCSRCAVGLPESSTFSPVPPSVCVHARACVCRLIPCPATCLEKWDSLGTREETVRVRSGSADSHRMLQMLSSRVRCEQEGLATKPQGDSKSSRRCCKRRHRKSEEDERRGADGQQTGVWGPLWVAGIYQVDPCKDAHARREQESWPGCRAKASSPSLGKHMRPRLEGCGCILQGSRLEEDIFPRRSAFATRPSCPLCRLASQSINTY